MDNSSGVWEHVGEMVWGLTSEWGHGPADPWVCSVVASLVIGLAGIVPLFVIPSDYHANRASGKQGDGGVLQLLLSFAVGGMLADVFLHLLPEAWTAALQAGLEPLEAFKLVGLCVLFGIFVFIIVEMMATAGAEASESCAATRATAGAEASESCAATRTAADHCATNDTTAEQQHSGYDNVTPTAKHTKQNSQPSVTKQNTYSKIENNTRASRQNHNNIKHQCRSPVNCNNTCNNINTNTIYNNNNTKHSSNHNEDLQYKEIERKIEVVGYLNLIANGIDNFAHGLAVAGSFMVSYKSGVLTTTAILIHEVPHEIGDFAILLNSGFSRWEAAKAQLYTAGVGLLGALFTLSLGSSALVGGVQLYILGFTSGAFLNISLCSVLPQLLKEERPSHSAAQMVALLLGTYTMASVAC